MDPISQGALGAAATLSIWGGDRRLSPRVVGWLGALSAMAPDLDVLIRSSEDPLLAIEYHRHFTHSLTFVPIGATIALLPWLLRRDVRDHVRLAWLVSVVGYVTHAPLDCATTYGTQFFWPWSDYRVSLSWVSVVDPLYTLPLVGFVLWSALSHRRRWARWGLGLSLGYLALGALQKARVSGVQSALIEKRGHAPVRRAVFTTFMNQVTWRSLYEQDDVIYIDQIRVPYLGAMCVKKGTIVPLLPPAPPNLGPRAARGHRLLRWFSDGWVAASPEQPELLGDVRYSFLPYGAEPFWGIEVDEKEDRVDWVQTSAERKIGISAIYDLIFENPPGSVCGDFRE